MPMPEIRSTSSLDMCDILGIGIGECLNGGNMYVDDSDCVDSDCVDSLQKVEEKVDKVLINDLKRELLDNGKYEIYRNIQYALYSKYCACAYGTEINHKYDMYLGIDCNFSALELKVLKQMYDSHRRRVQRLKQKIRFRVLNNKCLWLTLTFRDEVLYSTSELTRRRYISRFLKSLNIPFYVANIDYGDKEKNLESKEREHYHAIIQAEHIDMSLYNYGFIYVERINNSVDSVARISKYINKLTSHAFKDSTKNHSRLIYSRKTFVSNQQIIDYYSDVLPCYENIDF